MFNFLKYASYILVLIGAINWGLVGLFGFNLVEFLFGQSILTQLIYILVGFSAIISLITAIICYNRQYAEGE